MSQEEIITPEFSAEVDLTGLGRARKSFQLVADEAERGNIAARLGAIAVENLKGEVRLSATKTEITASGVFSATLIRQCVASLEPMTENIDDNFEIIFARATPSEPAMNNEDGVDLNQPEPHQGDSFDVGELLVQQLSLAMAAFPRKEGSVSLAEQYGQTGSDSPFAELRAALEKDKGKQ